MQRSASLSLARIIENQFYPIKGAWGSIAPSSEPKKNGTEENGKTRRIVADEKPADAIVAFSRPPPLPPVLGPLVALTLMNPWSKHDSNNDS